MQTMVMSHCERCALAKTRTRVVLPRGTNTAPVMFIGEAPGRNEDKVGLSFVGSAGKWFDAVVDFLQLKDKFYVTNIIKCRPVEGGRNREPSELEINCCCKWLREEIAAVQPRVIVLLGSTALHAFFRGNKIDNTAGCELYGHSVSEKYGTRVFVLFHPAVLVQDRGKLPEYREHLGLLRGLLAEVGI